MSNAMVEVWSYEVTSSVASIDTGTILGATYDTYYFVGTNISLQNTVSVRLIPKVSGSAKSGTFGNCANYYQLAGSGAWGTNSNGSYSTRDFITHIGFNVLSETSNSASNAFIEATIMNSQSGTHNTYSIGNSIGCVDTTTYYSRHHLVATEDNTADVYDGFVIQPDSGNINKGKFKIYGLINS